MIKIVSPSNNDIGLTTILPNKTYSGSLKDIVFSLSSQIKLSKKYNISKINGIPLSKIK